MLKLKEFINRIKAFLAENPKRAKFIALIVVAAALPLIIIAALTIQDLRLRAGGGPGVQITDASGNTISTTSDTQVYLRINLPVNWVFSDVEASRSGFIQQAYAQTICGDEICSPGQTCQTINEGGGVFSQICVGTFIPTSTPTPVPPTPTPVPPTPTPTPVACSSLSYNGKPNVCSNNSGTCPTDYLRYGYINESAGVGAIYGTNCTSSTTPSRTCCYYSPTTTADVPTSTPIPPTPTTVPPSPTPIPNILQGIYIENKNSDGSYNGSEPLRITSGFESYLNTQVPWKLNDLLPFQDQATRLVQVTFLGSRDIVYLTATVTLVRPSYPVSGTVVPPVSSTVVTPTSVPPANSSVNPYPTYDLNGDGVVNCKDTKILFGQYGQKGTGLSADFNQDGAVGGIDFNILIRNYTPGDTTVCN